MKITRDNYEQYFLDYLEGNLDGRLVDDFIEFLQDNPDLKEELHLVGSFKLESEPAVFKGKEKLYKSKFDQQNVFDDAAIAYIEGDLTEEAKSDFVAYLSIYPEKQKDVDLYEKTKQLADERIVFTGKSRLLHYNKGKTILLWFTRVAAVLVITFLVYRFADNVAVNYFMPDDQIMVSENKKEKTSPAQLPEKVEKEQDPVPVNESIKTPVKKSDTKAQPAKSLRESNKGRIDHEKVAQLRDTLVIPGEIASLTASLHSFEREVAALIPLSTQVEVVPLPENEEHLLADVVMEKTGLKNLSLKKVARAGLNLVTNFSKEKFNYETNSAGQVTELNFDSRLLAFSIPTNQDK